MQAYRVELNTMSLGSPIFRSTVVCLCVCVSTEGKSSREAALSLVYINLESFVTHIFFCCLKFPMKMECKIKIEGSILKIYVPH